MRIDKQVHIETEDDEMARVRSRVGSVYTMYAIHVSVYILTSSVLHPGAAAVIWVGI